MLTFLNKYYFDFGQDNLGSVLGEIQFLSENKTADPAAWYDWIEAVNKTLEENNPKQE